jgi:CBS domain containing-hemolysin-like protein
LGWHPATALLVIALTILLLGEVLPKTIFQERPNQLLNLFAPLHRLMGVLLLPLAWPLKRLSAKFTNGATEPSRKQMTALEREDLKILFASQSNTEVLHPTEKELISQVFDLSEISISKVMTPRTEVVAVAKTSELSEVIHTFIESGNSKLPVYGDSLDDIIGVVYLYDIFKAPEDLPSIVRPVTMVPSSNRVIDVLHKLQRVRRSIAIIIDEYGGTAGLVTLEDMFEEIFGDFEDEFDAPDSEITKQADGSFMVQGKTPIEDLIEQHKMPIPEGDYETVAGYVTSLVGRIPFTGERFYPDFGEIVVKKASVRRVEQVHIKPHQN